MEIVRGLNLELLSSPRGQEGDQAHTLEPPKRAPLEGEQESQTLASSSDSPASRQWETNRNAGRRSETGRARDNESGGGGLAHWALYSLEIARALTEISRLDHQSSRLAV